MSRLVKTELARSLREEDDDVNLHESYIAEPQVRAASGAMTSQVQKPTQFPPPQLQSDAAHVIIHVFIIKHFLFGTDFSNVDIFRSPQH